MTEKGMPEFRAEIDILDKKIVDLLAQRERIIHAVGEYKAKNNIPPIIMERKNQVTENYKRNAAAAGLNVDFAEELFELIFKYAIKTEETYK